MTPTQRTMDWMRRNGYQVDVVERWISYRLNGRTVRIRKDLFGFGDLLAFRANRVVIVQATSGSNTASRVTKIVENETAKEWVSNGLDIWVVGWRQLVVRNKDGSKAKRKRWAEKVHEVTVEDFE